MEVTMAWTETTRRHYRRDALRYARRYALFTLVGIAGEDDIDAPDLTAPTGQSSGAEKPDTSNSNGRMNGDQGPVISHTPVRGRRSTLPVQTKPTLEPDKSAALCDQLLIELAGLTSPEAATAWAHRILVAKYSLAAIDARRVEEAFQSKLAALGNGDAGMIEAPLSPNESGQQPLPVRSCAEKTSKRSASSGIDKSLLTLPEPRRVRDRDHVKFVARQPCLICGRRPSDAHHLRFTQHRALGGKVSDEFTVPLCRGHHREVHRCGNEAGWWEGVGVNPTVNARVFWLETHPLPATPNGTGRNAAKPSATPSQDRGNSKLDRRVGSQRAPRKTRSIRSTVPHGIA
jgi:hypothetical protein